MLVKIEVGIWRGNRKGVVVDVPDDDLTRYGLDQGHVSLVEPPAAEDPEPEPEAAVMTFEPEPGTAQTLRTVIAPIEKPEPPKKSALRRRGGSK